jgi:CubicO group peptidase (beta-lactamase class C family)
MHWMLQLLIAVAALQQLDAQAPGWLQKYDVPSVSVAYIEHGKVAWTAVYGEQSPGVPATGKTLYNVASLTKPITAEVILRLASAGKLSLDEPTSNAWTDPDLAGNPWEKKLTPRLCLSHQTGFSNWRRQTKGVLAMQWEPGTKTGYSGEGYQYAARFTEKKLRIPFDQLAQQEVFDAIGMKETSYTPKPWFKGRLAVPHGEDKAVDPEDWTWNAADLVRTTVSDYAKFVISVMHDEKLTKVIAKERATMTRELVNDKDRKAVCGERKPCEVSAGMALGWQIFAADGVKLFDHGGSDRGVRTHVFFNPETKDGAVIFTNGDNGGKVIREVAGVLIPGSPVYLNTLSH